MITCPLTLQYVNICLLIKVASLKHHLYIWENLIDIF